MNRDSVVNDYLDMVMTSPHDVTCQSQFDDNICQVYSFLQDIMSSPSSSSFDVESESDAKFCANEKTNDVAESEPAEGDYGNLPAPVADLMNTDDDDDDDHDDDDHDDDKVEASRQDAAGGDDWSADKAPRDVISSSPPAAAAQQSAPRSGKTPQLWQFLLETLRNPQHNPDCITWLDKRPGIFRFVQSSKVARLWGERRRRRAMSYPYFSRAMRHYYPRGMIQRVAGKRLVYQFLAKAIGWQKVAAMSPS